LASDLGIPIERRKGGETGAKASWRPGPGVVREPRLWDADEVIRVRREIGVTRETLSRFAIAHELGHAVFHRELSRHADTAIPEQEDFANSFASELLLVGVTGEKTKSALLAAGDPSALLALARTIGVPPVVLMKRAVADRWPVGPDVIWFDIRTVVNQHTNRERRLRVYRHLRDRSRWYLPRNRSVQGLFGSDEWLHSGLATTYFSGTIDLSRPTGRPTRLVHESIPVEVEALRLRPPAENGPGHGLEVLAHATLCPEEA
jgi:hypothetical protein